MQRLLLILLTVAYVHGPVGGQGFADVPPSFMCSAAEGQGAEAARWTVETELLIWWLRNGRVPPLLTTGAGQGTLDQSTTGVLYGNEKLDVNRHLGGRVTTSYWFDECQSLGLQARGLAIERNWRTWETASEGSRLLARPYYDANTGTATAEIIAGSAPGVGELRGAFYGFTKNELFGEQGSVILPLERANGFQLNLLLGACFLQMRERLELTATSELLPEATTILGTTDKWKIYNRFYGGHLGVQGEVWRGPWFVGFHGQCALGVTTHRVNAFGDRLAATPLTRDWQATGLLVQATNAGKSDNTAFDAVYEISVMAGCQLTSWLRVHAGYTLIYWTNPIRAGDQLDSVIGSVRPRIPFADDYFWAQGASAGLELSW